MLDEAELRRMSREDRAKLVQALAALDEPDRPDEPSVRFDERSVQFGQRFWLLITVAGCVSLVAWIGVLAATLPRHFTAGAWRGAWVGFDLALLAAFAVTAWAAWRRRQVLIVCLIVTATLLCCDAWFDLALDWRTHAFFWSLLSALLAELPVAIVMILGARRLLRPHHRGDDGARGRTRARAPAVAAGAVRERHTRPHRALPHRAPQGRSSGALAEVRVVLLHDPAVPVRLDGRPGAGGARCAVGRCASGAARPAHEVLSGVKPGAPAAGGALCRGLCRAREAMAGPRLRFPHHG